MLYLQIKEEIKTAMKNKDNDRKDVLKMVVDKAKAFVKEKNPTDVCENIPDDVILKAVKKELKQLNQTKDSLKGRENSELYISTANKIGILTSIIDLNLSTQMTENEVENYITDVLVKMSSSNVIISSKIKGMVMKNIMPELKDKADGKMINNVVDKLLAK